MSVLPQQGVTAIVTGGVALNAIPAGVAGGVITNPLIPFDQGLGAAEVLYINPVGSAALEANGSTFALQPGQSWNVIPGQLTPTSVNAASAGHKYSAVYWTEG